MALSGLGVAALLLAGGAPDRQGRLASWALALLAALLAMLAVLGAALPMAAGGDAVHWPLMGSLACVGVLLGASVGLPAGRGKRLLPVPEQRAAAVLVASGLCMAVLATLSAPVTPSAAAVWSDNRVITTITALFGGFTVGLAAVSALARVPRVPAGDLLVPIERAIAGLIAAWTRLGADVGHWSNRFDTAVGQMRRSLGRQAAVDGAESWLRRWSTATLLLLAVGAALALLVQPG
jgi:hypothetical protein